MGVRGQHAALELAGSVGAHEDRRQEEEGGPLLMEEVMGQERRMKGEEHTSYMQRVWYSEDRSQADRVRGQCATTCR